MAGLTSKQNGMKGGRPPGSVPQKVREKKAVEAMVQQMIMKRAAPLVRAAMVPALGQMFVYRIDEEYEPDKTRVDKKTGEETITKGALRKRVHVLVTDPDEIADALDKMEGMGHAGDREEYYYVTTKEPDSAAAERLFNRAFGKPKESLTLDGEVKFSLTGLAKQRDEMLDGNADMTLLDEPLTLPEAPEVIPEVVKVASSPAQVVVEAQHPTDTVIVTEAK